MVNKKKNQIMIWNSSMSIITLNFTNKTLLETQNVSWILKARLDYGYLWKINKFEHKRMINCKGLRYFSPCKTLIIRNLW